jgi:hypothetical protein
MGNQIGVATYWLGSFCAGTGLVARAFDVFGVSLVGISTKGGEITYHSLMDGTLFFYSISIATMLYSRFNAAASVADMDKRSEKIGKTSSLDPISAERVIQQGELVRA